MSRRRLKRASRRGGRLRRNTAGSPRQASIRRANAETRVRRAGAVASEAAAHLVGLEAGIGPRPRIAPPFAGIDTQVVDARIRRPIAR